MGSEKKEYEIGEVFRHTDGKVYQCVESELCKGCTFKYRDIGCLCGLNCRSTDREDGRNVKYIMVTEPSDGMLYRAEDGKMYQLKYGEPSSSGCACNVGMYGCGCLNEEVFGDVYLPGWYWAPVEEDAPAPVDPPKPVESPKPVEPPKRHIELGVVKVEGDNVTFRIVEQTHRRGEFSQQANTDEFKACNGIGLMSYSVPQWLSSASALYCRGEGKEQDNNRLTCTADEFARICEAVADYNETDGKGHGFSWPKNGDKYFCIARGGWVDRLTFDMDGFDRKMQAFGNFFRTKEEAEAALERVRQALKK